MFDDLHRIEERAIQVGDIVHLVKHNGCHYVVCCNNETRMYTLLNCNFTKIIEVDYDYPEIEYVGHVDNFSAKQRAFYTHGVEPHDGEIVVREDGTYGVVVKAGKMRNDRDIPEHTIMWEDGQCSKSIWTEFRRTRANVLGQCDDNYCDDDEDEEE